MVGIDTGKVRVEVECQQGVCPRLRWFDSGEQGGEAFLVDSKTRAYCFDASTGGVIHYVCSIVLVLSGDP